MAAPVSSNDRSAPVRAAKSSRQSQETIASPTAPLAGFSGTRRVPHPVNEPVKQYAPGSLEKAAIKSRLASMAKERIDIPLIIGGQEIRTGDTAKSVMPHDHAHVLADWHRATPKHVEQAIAAAKRASADWANWAWEDRAAVFLRAAELLTTTWRQTINAATMLGQSKTVYQAEIDSACELIDFWRFNPHYAQQLHEEQPLSNSTMWNQLDYRPLEGFVYAVTPFNFTSIAGNLPTAAQWQDRLIVRNTDLNQILGSLIDGYSDIGNVPLAPGASHIRSATVILPAGNSGAGNLSFQVTTDVTNVIAEQGASGQAELNNTLAANAAQRGPLNRDK